MFQNIAREYYYYVKVELGAKNFYGLSALVDCWTLVFIRRFIFKVLNVCPLIRPKKINVEFPLTLPKQIGLVGR